jgi:ABC-type glycerol-3-phosphate transport system substrate-binding protein
MTRWFLALLVLSAPFAAGAQPWHGLELGAESFGLPLAQGETARAYVGASVLLEPGDAVRVTVVAPAGDYTLSFDAAVPESVLSAPEGELRVNGAVPGGEAQGVRFPVYYRNSADAFPRDRYGNDALIRQVRDVRWTRAGAPLQLGAGEQQLELTLLSGAVYLGSLYLEPLEPPPSYAQYLEAHATLQNITPPDFLLTLEAEFPAFKNDTAVRPESDRDLTVTPYHTSRLLLNTLGGESWGESGSAVFYELSVPEDGFYAVTLHARQDIRRNFTVFRRVTVNGEVPFAELEAVPFPYAPGWTNVTLGTPAGEPYRIFLHAGVNVLGVEATNAPYAPAIATLQDALLDINALALEVRKLTGNQRDPFRDWVISDYLPDAQERLEALITRLRADQEKVKALSGGRNSPEAQSYQLAIDNLSFLAADPNKLPAFLSRFSEGPGSAAQQLGSLLPLLQQQPLALDKVHIHAPDVRPPTPAVPFAAALTEGVRRFVNSFAPDPYQVAQGEEGDLEVWVNRPRLYVNLLQLMADESFTPETGVRVDFSVMPDESKLVLAKAAGIEPDVALGVSTNVPFELAIRNALYDLRSFEDFDSFIGNFSPGALLSFIIDDSVYALPETQDFWVTFYRRDILDALGMSVPDTWNEVLELLPELQRYGMNYNTPLSSGPGLKGYLLTAPYLFNHGAPLYADGGFATGLESEEAVAAIRFMAESFTVYGMPISTASFYESFRYGTLPLGVSNLETYVKLLTAAPELAGLWGVALYPATVGPDGEQRRYATGSAQASIIFRDAEQPEAAWAFLKWWLSTPTQAEFQERLMLNYGRAYLWNSANLEAFGRLAIPEEHKAVILEQWQWLQEPVRLPGFYMQERELSNVWNRIVFDGAGVRVAIDGSVTSIDREIARRMEEFGYLRDGQRVREFKIPTIETVKGWIEGAERHPHVAR